MDTSLKQFEIFTKEEIDTLSNFVTGFMKELESSKQEVEGKYQFMISLLEASKKLKPGHSVNVFSSSGNVNLEDLDKKYEESIKSIEEEKLRYSGIQEKLKQLQDVTN